MRWIKFHNSHLTPTALSQWDINQEPSESEENESVQKCNRGPIGKSSDGQEQYKSNIKFGGRGRLGAKLENHYQLEERGGVDIVED